ncbi:lytic polysaccharide monooxygenase [Trametes coccinea BRFM310]|uniref:lytic cellulose monooxygenase (C4-dehydrogenating) n=1 Tax=Trametes coccinea (strain BRFM310) TaxID=1353009 RepID=A0A1Y2ISJ1_TRAC3|nr:lytic polysaccharide monooxygenase [Trametes coccinea BRFM310]
MFSAILTLLVTALAATRVDAHGYVQEVVIGSTHYTGYLPYQDPYYPVPPERIIRKIPGNGPVTDVTLIDLQCNGDSPDGIIGSAPAPLFAPVNAGDEIKLNWTTWPDSHVGPMITYLARAPSDITKWQPGDDAVWFKVAEAGKTADGKWAATDLLSAADSIYTFTIPPNLQPGQYIIRHEIIALHGAFAYPGAQFYPSCIQIEVSGSGNAFPDASSLVSFPGAYTPETPGIVFDVYDNTSQPYPIPGPAVWTGGN